MAFMLPHTFGRDQELIKSVRRAGWLVGEIPPHRRERHENLVYVPAVVGGVLLLLRHHANDEIRNSVQVDIFANGISSFGEELFGSVRSKESYAAAFALIIPVIEPTRTDGQTTNVAKLGIRTGDQKRSVVVIAVSTDIALLQFRNCVLAVRPFRLYRLNIGVFPMHNFARAGSSRLKAGSPVEDNHDVLAQVTGLYFLAFAQPLSRRHHEYDGDDSPSNAEHGQERPQLVSPERAEDIADKVA